MTAARTGKLIVKVKRFYWFSAAHEDLSQCLTDSMLQCSVCCQKQRRFFVRGILVFLEKKNCQRGKIYFHKNRKASALGTLDQKRRWLIVTWAEWAVTVRELIIWYPVKCVNNYAGHFASNDHTSVTGVTA